MGTKLPRIYADFNKLHGDTLVLTTWGTYRSLCRERLCFSSGQRMIFFSEDLEVEGTVFYAEGSHTRPGYWAAKVIPDAIRDVPATDERLPRSVPCWSCGTDVTSVFERTGFPTSESCPSCGKPLWAPFYPPAESHPNVTTPRPAV